MRAWSDSPDPGDDYNCRCWAKHVADDQILKEELPPPEIKTPKIPGTDIPDRGIPEQGWPGSEKYDPYKLGITKDNEKYIDPYFVMPTTRKDQFMEKFPPKQRVVKKEWGL